MKNTLFSSFPKIAGELSADNPFTANEVAPYSSKIASWDCTKGHSWTARVSSRTSQGQGCSVCRGLQVAEGYNDLLSQNAKIASEWDYRRNYPLRPEEVAFGTHRKVWWECKAKGHSWETQVFARTNGGNNCPYCSGKKILTGYNDFAFLSPLLLEEWDCEKNTVDPTKIGLASHSKAWWSCKKYGHSYQALVKSRTLGNDGCPVCSNNKVLIGFNDLATTHPDLLVEWNYDKNAVLPTDITYGSKQKIWWKCVREHEWLISAGSRTNRQTKCPQCKLFSTSQIEKDFRLAVAANPAFVNVAPGNVNIPIPGKPRGLNVDIFCEFASTGQKLVIEYDGSYWHGENSPAKNVKERDLASTKLLLNSGYLVVRIRENELKFLPLEKPSFFQFKYNHSDKGFGVLNDVVAMLHKFIC